jgi:cytochrome c6
MLKNLITLVLAVIAAIALFAPTPAIAADAADGKQIFSANCAACHAGGRNAVNPTKTLQKADLEKWEMYDAAAIVTQVTNGKGAMPAFSGKLNGEQIENVTAYVLAQADNSWAK